MDRTGCPFPAAEVADRYEHGRVPRVEAYETGPETVIFDGENPLAWIASSAAVPIRQQA